MVIVIVFGESGKQKSRKVARENCQGEYDNRMNSPAGK